jgi:ribosomal protein S4
MGIVSMGASLDDVLALDTESVLSRRLQTLVYLKGYSSTPYQARQLISHGHVAVSGKKVTIPSYMVAKNEESQIQYTIRSPLNELSHPARPKGEVYKTEQAVAPVTPTVEKPVAVVPPKQEPVAIVAPATQPVAVVPVPTLPAESTPAPTVEKPAEEKIAKPAEKPKEHPKKEKKTEEGA